MPVCDVAHRYVRSTQERRYDESGDLWADDADGRIQAMIVYLAPENRWADVKK